MEKIFTIIEDGIDNVVLFDEKKGKKINWPRQYLPENFKIGDKISFFISFENDSRKHDKQLAKNILNEILNIEGDNV